jgi:CubicO group peptidase (beta-lactamase class C family)
VVRPNKALGHVLVDGKWVQKFKRDPDAQSPAGGVSSSVNDVARWMRLQLANGKFDGKQVVDEKALAETHHPHMLTGFNPFTRGCRLSTAWDGTSATISRVGCA